MLCFRKIDIISYSDFQEKERMHIMMEAHAGGRQSLLGLSVNIKCRWKQCPFNVKSMYIITQQVLQTLMPQGLGT